MWLMTVGMTGDRVSMPGDGVSMPDGEVSVIGSIFLVRVDI